VLGRRWIKMEDQSAKRKTLSDVISSIERKVDSIEANVFGAGPGEGQMPGEETLSTSKLDMYMRKLEKLSTRLERINTELGMV
jgi:hypothetical protein